MWEPKICQPHGTILLICFKRLCLPKGRIKCLRVDDPEDLRKGIMRWNGMLEVQEVFEKALFCTAKCGHLGAG
jgi:hypothetical protein